MAVVLHKKCSTTAIFISHYYNKDTADVIYYQQLCGTQISPSNLSQILQNTLRDNRTANISANEYDN